MRMIGIIISTLVYQFGNANVAQEEVFTENGPPVGYPSEEDMLGFLINNEDRLDKWPESIGDVDEEKVDDDGWNRDFIDGGENMEIPNGKQAPEKSIRKREGQEEFPTFVDPGKIGIYSTGQQQNYFVGDYEKRAKVDDISRSVANENVGDTIFIATTTVCTAAAVFGLIVAAFTWRRVHKRRLASEECEYPNYGVTGPSKERSGSSSPVSTMDAKLASSAHLYHYQHTKQQIIAMEQPTGEGKARDTDDSEGEEDEGDFSVYEYPGLAPTGDMEVANPLFENMGSPVTKTDPKQPHVHQQFHFKE